MPILTIVKHLLSTSPSQITGVAFAILVFITACSSNPYELTAPETSWLSFTDKDAHNFQAECRSNISRAEFMLKQLEKNKIEGRNLLKGINQFDILVANNLNESKLYRNTHPIADVRTAADECYQKNNNIGIDLSLSKSIFEQLNSLDLNALTQADTHFVGQRIMDFKRAGVHLADDTRIRIRQLQNDIQRLTNEFTLNIHKTPQTITLNSAARLTGLPERYIESHPKNKQGNITLTTHYDDYAPLMRYAHDDALRLQAYSEYRKRGYPDNQIVLKNLLEKRYALATLLGYENYAEFIVQNFIIKSPSDADLFINQLNILALPIAQEEYNRLLQELKTLNPNADSVGPWQKLFLTERISAQNNATPTTLETPSFTYTDVQAAMFDLAHHQLGLTIKPWKTDLWHNTVESYSLYKGEKLIGHFYLDMEPREGKTHFTSTFTVQNGVLNTQLPTAAIVSRYSNPEKPKLTRQQADDLLLQFGRLFYSLLTEQQGWHYFAEKKTQSELAEITANLFKTWAWNSEHLLKVSPSQNTIATESKLSDALWLRQQLFYAAVSLSLYDKNPAEIDLNRIVRQLQATYSPYQYVEGTFFHNSFDHLTETSANYSQFIVAQVLSADINKAFNSSPTEFRATFKRYETTLLSNGNKKTEMALIEEFLGRPFNLEAYIQQFQLERE